MSASVPFSITSDAEDYVRNRLNEMPPEAKPVLMMAETQTDDEKTHRWFYKGQSFIIGYFDPAEMPKAEYIESELFGRRIAIDPDALKQLAGRTLSLRRVDAHYGLMENTSYVLVASSAPESPVSTFGADDSNESSKRRFSIVALTILGGFTGIGVIWIVGAIAAQVLKISDEKFLSLILPLFVAGWIIGAIVSFFFFRSVFRAKGRTRFVQEQTQRKYLGYGGMSGQLSWWIFLGIPVLLTAVLIFAFEPFAHTDGQKAGVAVGALMVVFATSMYFCDRIPHRIVIRLGLLGWALTIAGGYWYFKT